MSHPRGERREAALDYHTARRRFLLKTLGLGAAGLAAGGAGALAKAEWDSASLAASSAAATVADLQLQLDGAVAGRAALEFSNATLQAQATMEFFMSGSIAKVLTLATVIGILMLRPQGLFAIRVRR